MTISAMFETLRPRSDVPRGTVAKDGLAQVTAGRADTAHRAVMDFLAQEEPPLKQPALPPILSGAIQPGKQHQ